MKTARHSLITLALTAAATSMSFAADASAPKTRDQVRAELVEAQRNGSLIADGQTGATFRDLAPHRYGTQTMTMQPSAQPTAMHTLSQMIQVSQAHQLTLR